MLAARAQTPRQATTTRRRLSFAGKVHNPFIASLCGLLCHEPQIRSFSHTPFFVWLVLSWLHSDDGDAGKFYFLPSLYALFFSFCVTCPSWGKIDLMGYAREHEHQWPEKKKKKLVFFFRGHRAGEKEKRSLMLLLHYLIRCNPFLSAACL